MKCFPAAFISLCLVSLNAHAQFSHAFGDITPVEINMKECSFDPEANAVVLVDEGLADHDGEYQLITTHHRRLKVLKEKGVDIADISIRFSTEDKFEYLSDIEAMTINFDDNGSRTEYKVDRKLIYTKKLNQYLSEVSFAFPQVKVGSIIEYSYRSIKKHFGGLRDWAFQETLPVCFSSFELSPAPNLEFTYAVQKSTAFPVIVRRAVATNSIYFEMDSLPGLGDEPYMDARADYLQEVRFTITKFAGGVGSIKYMSDWNEVARELWSASYLGDEMRANLREPQALVAAAVAGKSDLEKMNIIYNFVRSKIEWNNVYARYADEGVRNTWNKKTGNSGCINTLLINLLRSANLEAYPLMVSERGNGKINVKIPFINQFDNVYAAVIINGKNYYLDATDSYCPSWMKPSSVLNTTALLVKKNKGELIDIKEPDLKYRETVFINATLAGDGNLMANVYTTGKDYARQQHLSQYGKAKTKEKYIEDYLGRGLINIKIDSLEVTGADNDSADFSGKFKMSTGLQATGDYAFLGLNMFSGFETNPFIINNRFSNINFGYNKLVTLSWLIKVPEGWSVDALPKNIKMINSDSTASFYRHVVYDKQVSQISARIRVELNKSLFSVDEYPELKEFYKKMFAMLNEQIVFKTK